MKKTKKKTKKESSSLLLSDKQIAERNYSESTGLPPVDRSYPDYPFAEGEGKDLEKDDINNANEK